MFYHFSGRYPEEGLLAHMVTLSLIFWGTSILLSVVAVPVPIPTSSEWGFLFATTSPTLVITCRVDNSHSNTCEVVSHCSSLCISLIDSDVEHLFMYLLVTCSLLGRSVCSWSSAHFNWITSFLLLMCMSSLYMFLNLKKLYCPGWCGSVDWALDCKTKRCWFDS